jgi:hypothetical protein
MNNTNINTNSILEEATKYINKLYDKTTFSDIYGSSIVICILVTIIILFILLYSIFMQQKKEIYADWNNNRCKAKYIPLAGFIAAPEGQSINDYTMENFQYCLNSQATSTAGYLLQPITFMTTSLLTLASNTWIAIDSMRGMFASFRENLSEFIKQIMGKILNLITPITVIIIAFLDSLQKTQAVMVTGLFSIMSIYNAMESAIGATLEFMTKVLLMLLAIIAILWLIPGIGWVTALSLSGIYIGASVVLSVMIIFISIIFNTPPIHMSIKNPFKGCFDKNVLFTMENGQSKRIYDINVGDILANGNKVTAKMKIDISNYRMFNIKDIIVSESHVIKYGNQWIPIKDHPEAVEIFDYSEPYLYCLNTNSKIIEQNGLIFTDWDEIYDDTLDKILEVIPTNIFEKDHTKKCMNIHRYLDVGFHEDTIIDLNNNTSKKIKDIQINDVLLSGGKVYGIVEIETTEMATPFCVEKSKSKQLSSVSYKPKMDILNEDVNEGCKQTELSLGNKLYHLLTTNKNFSSNNTIIPDYNDHIDKLLKK